MRTTAAVLLAGLTLAACSTEPIGFDPPPMNPMAPPVDFSATGELPCSANAPSLDGMCVFGITRGAGGSAALHVLNPASDVHGIQRVLTYQAGSWSTLDGSPVETMRRGGATLIAINETEFYTVPDPVLTGG